MITSEEDSYILQSKLGSRACSQVHVPDGFLRGLHNVRQLREDEIIGEDKYRELLSLLLEKYFPHV